MCVNGWASGLCFTLQIPTPITGTCIIKFLLNPLLIIAKLKSCHCAPGRILITCQSKVNIIQLKIIQIHERSEYSYIGFFMFVFQEKSLEVCSRSVLNFRGLIFQFFSSSLLFLC